MSSSNCIFLGLITRKKKKEEEELLLYVCKMDGTELSGPPSGAGKFTKEKKKSSRKVGRLLSTNFTYADNGTES
jgi:hypothetical protein